jgi:uncharacterized protein YciI
MAEFVCFLRPTRPDMLVTGLTGEEASAVDDHGAYLDGLAAEGSIILYGRTQRNDESAVGLVIFEADSEDEANRLVDADPVVQRGVMTAQVLPYRVAYIRRR